MGVMAAAIVYFRYYRDIFISIPPLNFGTKVDVAESRIRASRATTQHRRKLVVHWPWHRPSGTGLSSAIMAAPPGTLRGIVECCIL